MQTTPESPRLRRWTVVASLTSCVGTSLSIVFIIGILLPEISEELDLSPLENAVAQLQEALELYDSDIVRQYPETRNHFRAAAIQAFEFTYELGIAIIKRYLKEVSANPSQVDQLSFRNLMRRAAQHDLLLAEPNHWEDYRAARGSTSHAYNEALAAWVFQGIPEFLDEARYLLKQLQERNDLLD